MLSDFSQKLSEAVILSLVMEGEAINLSFRKRLKIIFRVSYHEVTVEMSSR